MRARRPPTPPPPPDLRPRARFPRSPPFPSPPSGTWCLGRISSVNIGEATFNVQYDDGELEAHVPAHSLPPAEEAETKAESEPLPFACTLFSSGVKSAGGMPGVPGGSPAPRATGRSRGDFRRAVT